ncbi:MAG: ABC transporter substrate-binding protein [Phascolarctobacterium sp.]|nr:ABC transporter substrate-binding protein [Phascolarctobacterium sp.]
MQLSNKKFLVAGLAVLTALTFTACGGKESTNKQAKVEKQIVVDIKGNKVEVPKQIKKLAVVPIPWASVVYALDGNSQRLAAIHPGARAAYTGKFLEKKDKHYGTIDIKMINQNFSVNMESMAAAGIEACLLWQYQESDAKKLQDIGVKSVLIYNDNVENLKKSFMIVGKLIDKEAKAKKLCDYYDNAYNSIVARKDEVAKAKKPTILFLRNAQLRLQGNDNFMHQALEIGGAYNPIDQSALDSNNKSIPMEEIYKINPDIIFLSNFDKFVPDDLYNNKLPAQDWSSIKAVKNKRVYKVPMGIYRWDAPGVETPLMMRWIAHTMQPEIFKDVDIRKETKAFYKEFLNMELTDEDMAQIFADEANKNSVPLDKK